MTIKLASPLVLIGWLLFAAGALLKIASIAVTPLFVVVVIFADSPSMQAAVADWGLVLMVLGRSMPVVAILGAAIAIIGHVLNWWRRKKIRTAQNSD